MTLDANETATTTTEPETPTRSNQSLFDIGVDLIDLENLLTDLDGDITDKEVEEELERYFKLIDDDLPRKVDNYVGLIKTLLGRAEIRQNEADRLLALVQVDKNAADRLKNRLKLFLELTKRTSIETKRYKVGLQLNGGKAPLVLLDGLKDNPEEIPEPFRIEDTVYKPDNDKIRAELENGATLEWAFIAERGKHLRIK